MFVVAPEVTKRSKSINVIGTLLYERDSFRFCVSLPMFAISKDHFSQYQNRTAGAQVHSPKIF